MATFYSTYQAAQRAPQALHTRANRGPLTRIRRTATFYYTPDDTEVNAERIVLGQLGIPGRIVADQCKIRYTGSGTLDVKFTLQKGNAALDTFTALTAITATITAVTSATALAAVAGAGDLPTVEHDDYLAVLLSTGASAVTLPATAGLIFEVVYDTEG